MERDVDVFAFRCGVRRRVMGPESSVSTTLVGTHTCDLTQLSVVIQRKFQINQLLTRDHLSKVFSLSSVNCPVCDSDQESHGYLFVDCPFTKQVFVEISKWLGVFE
ncbi:hypothetical protein F8388_025112 [Cannabis sativa]|uniref:Reverse transcriptase zinc-binding domain-containing protein n=1 Tax=Cannabis sativa TaxID=3483 RepID=A0A7J6FJ40_CANSA|nr:hypothetical protein F8388_025112 [Cannabis sativa]